MNTKFGWRNIVKVLGIILAAVVTAYSTMGDYFNLPTLGDWKFTGIFFGVVIFLMIILWHFLELQSKIDIFESATPTISVNNVGVELKGFVNGIYKDTLYMDVYNTPKIRTENSTAKKVVPTIEWYDTRRKPITQNSGRWWIPNPNEEKNKISQQSVDLESNGMVRRLHFAIKEPNENHFYAWSREKDGREGKFKLLGKKYFVKIFLRGNNNVDVHFEYIVENKRGKLSIKDMLPNETTKKNNSRPKKIRKITRM